MLGRMGGVLLVCALAVGCGEGGASASSADEGMPAEAVVVRKAFESAPASLKNPVTEVLKLLKSGGENASATAEAIPQLKKLAAKPPISD